jgi:hypothetical protein
MVAVRVKVVFDRRTATDRRAQQWLVAVIDEPGGR